MSLFTQGLGEVWGAVSSPIQTIQAAGSNLWNSIKFNIGYIAGNDAARDQVQHDIDKSRQEEQDYYNLNPGASRSDYTDYVTDKFGGNYYDYVTQPNTGSADNAVSRMSNDQIMQIGIMAAAVVLLISIFRR